MQVAATLRYARISPQKCRLVADAIRGKSVDEALRTLTFSPKKSARIVKKVLESAVANAEHNHGADIDELKVATIEVNEAPTFRRFRARAKGRGATNYQAQQPHHDPRRGRVSNMGQKVHPTGIRLGIVKDWASKWYADSKTFPKYIRADHLIRVFIKKKLKDASVSNIAIERPAKKVQHHDFHGASRHRDRQEGRGYREAAR